MDTSFSVAVENAGSVSCLRTAPARKRGGWTFVYAPGAGSNLRDPFGVFAATALAARGVTTVRFQFPYMQAGRSSPDRPPLLEATWGAVIDAVRSDAARLVIGGRSMGGRIASQVLAQGAAGDALALFAYPLHAPGKPDQLRVEHFAKIRVPALFCSGTRDAFASPEELRAAAKGVRGAEVHLLEAADHGFSAPKSSGRTREDIWSEAVETMLAWLTKLK